MHVRWATPDDKKFLIEQTKREVHVDALREEDFDERTLVAVRGSAIVAWVLVLIGVHNVFLMAVYVVPEERSHALGSNACFTLLSALLCYTKEQKARLWFTLDEGQQKWLDNISKVTPVYVKPSAKLFFVGECTCPGV